MNEKLYTLPTFTFENNPFNSIIHSILGNPFTISMVYYLLQYQYLNSFNNPKLIEFLFYFIQAISRCSGEEEYDESLLGTSSFFS